MKPTLFFLCLLGSVASGFLTTTTPVPSNKRQNSITKMSPYDPSAKSGNNANAMAVRGGAALKAAADSTGAVPGESKCPFSKFIQLSSSLYGTTGVMYILIKAIKRVYPIALEPFAKGGVPLTQFQLGYVTRFTLLRKSSSSRIINHFSYPNSFHTTALTSPLVSGLPTWKDTKASKPNLLLLSSLALLHWSFNTPKFITTYSHLSTQWVSFMLPRSE
jgi:hypothetical protein